MPPHPKIAWIESRLRAAAFRPDLARRRVLGALAASVAFAGCRPLLRGAEPFRAERDPFALGVASGIPRPDGVVLWTRLAYAPVDGGQLPPQPVEVRWEVAEDERFARVVARGSEIADPDWAHGVHAEVAGLAPGRWYWYRFAAGGAESPVGRTRTAPAADALPARLRFAFASCQHWEHGRYAAWRHLAAEDVELVVFLGDYIYESSIARDAVRRHLGEEPRTLAGYRLRHAQYKTDPNLARAHAGVPWLVTWDDHEVDNDYAGDRDEALDPRFLLRRAAAYRAYYEHMPLARASLPQGPDMRIYGRHAFGRLVEFHVLDDRQYRSPQVCPRPGRGGSNTVEHCPEVEDPARTMLGREQEAWLRDGLVASGARWKVLAQQTLMARIDGQPGPGRRFWTDGWDGYPQDRARLLGHIRDRRIADVVVIGGDVHANYVCDLKPDFEDPRSPVVATEFCGTSISSRGLAQSRLDSWLPENPHVRFANSERRGYAVVDATAKSLETTQRVVTDVRAEDAGIETLGRWRVESGRAGATRA
jgi:alkaline phosphatase D